MRKRNLYTIYKILFKFKWKKIFIGVEIDKIQGYRKEHEKEIWYILRFYPFPMVEINLYIIKVTIEE